MKQDRRTIAAALAGLPLLGGVARAQTPPVKVAIETAAGTITLELYGDKAPITVANFLRYVDEKRFDGAEFYRTVRPPAMPQTGLLQGGCHGDPKRLLPPITHEPTSLTGLRHKVGTISMPRRELGTADGEFFICLDDSPWYDVNPIKPGDNLGYAAFGQVVEGMEVVRAIHAMPVSPTEGADYGMAGQILDPPVRISLARRV
ncbi:MAG: peptidylprolyl isomerase [Phenylobacterium sp.]|nr:peptidylprolyl isomerase [Phenylobacterium sp.]